jgi:hypothetical protein
LDGKYKKYYRSISLRGKEGEVSGIVQYGTATKKNKTTSFTGSCWMRFGISNRAKKKISAQEMGLIILRGDGANVVSWMDDNFNFWRWRPQIKSDPRNLSGP